MAGESHGHGSSSALPKVFGWVAAGAFALLVINGVLNRIDGRPLLSNIFGGSISDFRGLSGPPGPASPRIGRPTGAPGNCPVGVSVGQSYKCPTSRTGYCICQ